MFLEYASRGSLVDLMNKIGSKILKIDANTIPRMILEGFLYIHRKVFIHYDLKPGNLLFFLFSMIFWFNYPKNCQFRVS